ncbi:hypothetical protein [Luteimonas terrae]|uniref:Uncharacterized protein n=1 Tax=Luteimonas terrae TaxID=1530191 RepID=A0A4R5UCN9_9GAMM|nr:hypothetical protein [Luteimonas terrae]TDK33028.1 hypothetical protein E2F49_02970 [Luteimonas terrae]
MNAHVDQGAIANTPVAGGQSVIGRFFDTLFGTVFLVLLAAGLIALTVTWQSTTLEFDGTNRLTVKQDRWWGLQPKTTVLEASPVDGWTIIDEDGGRRPLRAQSLRLPR